MSWASWVRTVRATPVDTGDVVLATGLLAFALAELLGLPEVDRSVAAPTAVAMTVPLLWRRRAPVVVVALVIGAFATEVLLGVPDNAQLAPLAAMVVACFSVGAHAGTRSAWVGLALAAVLAGSTVPSGEGNSLSDYGFAALLVGGSWAAGRVVRARSKQAQAETRRAARLVAESDERARRAAETERRRIARELHDIVAHSISLMVVQAGGAQHVVRSDPARAEDALVTIQQIGRQSLVEMKRLLGVLREPDEREELNPSPALDDVKALVEQMRTSGMSVDLDTSDCPDVADEGVGLSVYRIVQEALVNVLKHAPGSRVRVQIRGTDHALQVDVTNDGSEVTVPGTREGKGLIGMRERAELLGGELVAGPRPGGGFTVRGRIPLERTSAR